MNDSRIEQAARVEDPRLAYLFRQIWATAATIPHDDDEQIQTAARFIQALMPDALRAPLLTALMALHMDLTGSPWALFDEANQATYDAEVRAIRVLVDELTAQQRIHHALNELIAEEIRENQRDEERDDTTDEDEEEGTDG